MIKITDPRIPHFVYAMFPRMVRDKESLKRLDKMMKIGHDNEYAQLFFGFKKEGKFITKILNYRVNSDKNVIIATLANGFRMIMPFTLLPTDDIDRLIELLKQPIVVSAKLVKENLLLANKVDFGTRKVSTDIAREILEQDGISALLYGLGLKPKWNVFLMYLPRILGLFKGYLSREHEIPIIPLYITELSNKGTGKSTFADRIAQCFNYLYRGIEYLSPTALVGDARDGSLGVAATYDGIIFDEADKRTFQRKQMFTELIGFLQTGMEQGHWSRGKGSRPIEYRRYIHLMFFGNNTNIPVAKNSRDAFIQYWGVDGIDALVDRMTLVEINYDEFYPDNYAIHAILPDHIYRGLIQVLQEQIKKSEFSIELPSRLYRHALNFKSVLETMGLVIDDTLVAQIITGNKSVTMLSVPYPEKILKEVDESKIKKYSEESEVEEEKELEKEVKNE